jgi:hypothetical protein
MGTACGPVTAVPAQFMMGARIMFPTKYMRRMMNVFTIRAVPARNISNELAIYCSPGTPTLSFTK